MNKNQESGTNTKGKNWSPERFHIGLDGLGPGEKRRLYEMMFAHGPGNGKIMLLPIDQGLEHGPRDFFDNPPAADLEFELTLAAEAGFSGIACHIGLAEKHMKKWAGRVPLVLKINGKTSILPDDRPFSPLDASVEDALRLGADAVGYTLYVGSPAEAEDIAQFTRVRQEARRFGMPVIMWAYPRGPHVESRGGGRDSLAMVDYAARLANELGATLCKINLPEPPKAEVEALSSPFKAYGRFKNLTQEQALRAAVHSAGRTGVLVSGGSRLKDEELLKKSRLCLEAGVDGLIFGRNVWQRKYEDALKISREIRDMMRSFASAPPRPA
ncbi:MAG: fructose-bisphosphate aldolase [Candidatus Aminicenantes bacterium]|nr:fructose-bisphosphate aldolase [Candidatus Aminicenantes bacterium]